MSLADKAKKPEPPPRTTQPDSVGVHHGGFWSRRPRFESESGYLLNTLNCDRWLSLTSAQRDTCNL